MQKQEVLFLFDLNNLFHRHLHRDLASARRGEWRQWAYNVLRSIDWHVEELIGELNSGSDGTRYFACVVLALDSLSGYWRQELYPQYKSNRASLRERSGDGIDWACAYAEFEHFAHAIAEHTPYRVLRVDGCEADDVIYVLAGRHDGPVIVHSNDSDYWQMVSDNVQVYTPTAREYVSFPRTCRISGQEVFCGDVREFLQYSILTGQGGKDNVPNVRTPSDWNHDTRKPPFGIVAASKALADPRGLEEHLRGLGLLENYERNRSLIDMSLIPDNIRERIVEAYASCVPSKANTGEIAKMYSWYGFCGRSVDDMLTRLTTGEETVEDGIVVDDAAEAEVLDFAI